jgi:hypothetical protein
VLGNGLQMMLFLVDHLQMLTKESRKEKARKQKILGNLAEDGVIKLFALHKKPCKNLNEIRHNFPLIDIESDGEHYQVKARNKFSEDGKLNSCYNICRSSQSQSKLKSYNRVLSEQGMPFDKNKLNCITIPYEKDVWCPVYSVPFNDIPNTQIEEFFNGQPTFIGIRMQEKYTSTYSILGYMKIDIETQSVQVK